MGLLAPDSLPEPGQLAPVANSLNSYWLSRNIFCFLKLCDSEFKKLVTQTVIPITTCPLSWPVPVAASSKPTNCTHIRMIPH